MDVVNRQIDLTPLNGTDIGAMDVGPVGELFLTDAQALPARSQVRREYQSER